MIKCAVFCFSAIILGVNCAKAPFIKPCKVDDTACIFASGKAALPFFAAGIPSLGVPSADPLILDEVRGDNGELKLGFRNMKIVGISKCKLTALEPRGERSYRLVLECPVEATGQYSLGSKLYVVPLEGEGDFEIKTDNIRIIVEVVTEDVVDAAGEKHWKIASYNSNYEPIEKIHIHLDKLFNGDKKKADAFLEVLDHGWRDIVTEVGKPVIQAIIDNAVNIVEKFFEATAADELIIQ